MDLLYTFCGNDVFLNASIFVQERPVFSSCFSDTLPVWISCGFLWISALPFTVFMLKSKSLPLPFSFLHIAKITLCMALICLVDLHFTFRQMYGSECQGLELVPTSAQLALGIKLATLQYIVPITTIFTSLGGHLCWQIQQALLLVAGLTQMQKRCGLKTSGVLFSYWLLMIISELFRLYSYAINQSYCKTHVVFYVYFGFLCVQLLIHCYAEKDRLPVPSGKVLCPLDDSSVLTRLTYNWMTSIVYSVFKKTFKTEKMWLQTKMLKTSIVGPSLEQRWNAELDKERNKTGPRPSINLYVEPRTDDFSTSDNSESTPLLTRLETANKHADYKHPRASLIKIVLRENRFEILEYMFYSWLSSASYFVMPNVLGTFIDFIDNKDNAAAPMWIGIILSLIIVLSMEASSIFYNIQSHYTASLGLKIKHSLMYLIYRKALTVAKSENKISVGEVVNHMSVDCQRIQDAFFYSYYLPNAIIFIVAATFMLYQTVGGPATIGGVLTLLLIVPLNAYIVRAQNDIQKNILNLKGLRVRLMNEMLCGIKVLKMYAWELTFVKKINDIRTKEEKELKRNAVLMAIGTSVASLGQFVIHFVVILLYAVLSSKDWYVSSSVMFVSFSVVVVIKYPIVLMPTIMNTLVQAYVSLNRIEEYLCSSDLDDVETAVGKNTGAILDMLVSLRTETRLKTPEAGSIGQTEELPEDAELFRTVRV